LIVASSFLFRRWLQPGIVSRKTRQVQLLETIRLSPKQALHLVSIGDQQLLVGATDQAISLLTQVELDLNHEEMQSISQSAGTDFPSLLQALNFRSSDSAAK
jgi:flagellar biogenesis protein FliO